MTELRLPVVGDLHLTTGPRNQDRIDALDRMIAAEAPRRPSAWLWPGDITHTGMTIEIRNLLVPRVIAMADVAPVVIVPGNHDPSGDLDFLARLKATHPIYVVTAPGVRIVPIDGCVLALACVPYPSKVALVAAGTPHEKLNEAVRAAFDLIFMELGAELETHRRSGYLTGAIGHVNISGSISSVGQPQIGAELEIDPTHLARLGECFKVFNHIHKHQTVGGAVYPGSMCRLDWGETEPKGYVLVSIDDAGPTREDRWRHRETFVDVEIPRMYHVEGTLTRDAFDWRVTKGPGGPADEPPRGVAATDPADAQQFAFHLEGAGVEAPIDWTGCDVRVRASYPQAERDVLATARDRVRAEFAAARRFEFEPMAVSDRALRAPEVVNATTDAEKLVAWARLSGVAWSASIEQASTLLLGTEDGDALVALVEARVAALAAEPEVASC